jgi:protein TonB
MAALGVHSSLLAHLLAAGVILVVPWGKFWSSDKTDPAKLAGQRGVILIQAAFAEPEPPPMEVEIPTTDSPVVVTPNEARIEERTMVATSAAEVELTIEVAELSRAPASSVPYTAAKPNLEATHQPQVTHPVPRLPKAAAAPPMTVGFEEGASFVGNAPPQYPDQARHNGWAGTVLLRLSVDASGQVTRVQIERSSGYAVLDASAVNAVRHWKGHPARRDGRFIATEELLPVTFRLPGR